MNTSPPVTLPSEVEITRAIGKIQRRLRNPAMSLPINRAIREGYTESIAILAEGRTNYAGIDRLTTTHGRAIAILAVDYLTGETTQTILCNVLLKKPIK